jgi:outer membrane protein, heavy metal efflux system
MSRYSIAIAEEQIHASINTVQKALTLNQAYELAMKNNLEIQAAKKKMAEAEADILIAKIRQNPVLMSDLGFKAEKTYRVAGLFFILEPPGKRKRRIQVAQAHALQEEADVKSQINTILGDVHDAYVQWLVAITKLYFEEKNITMLKAIAKVAESRLKAKEVEELDDNQAQLLVADAENKVLSMKRDLEAVRTRLHRVLNTQDLQEPLVEDFFKVTELVQTPLSSLVKSGFNQRQDLISKRLEAEVETRNIALFKRSRIPSLGITSGFDMVQPIPHQFTSGTFQMGQIELPIFNRQQGTISKAKASHARAEAEAASLQQKIEGEIQTEYNNLQFLKKEWQSCQEKQLPLADKVDTQALDSYRRGKSSINDVLGQHSNAYGARLDAIDIYERYQNSLVNLETALNQNKPH